MKGLIMKIWVAAENNRKYLYVFIGNKPIWSKNTGTFYPPEKGIYVGWVKTGLFKKIIRLSSDKPQCKEMIVRRCWEGERPMFFIHRHWTTHHRLSLDHPFIDQRGKVEVERKLMMSFCHQDYHKYAPKSFHLPVGSHEYIELVLENI